jgi:tRNA(adenine34) deaminase
MCTILNSIKLTTKIHYFSDKRSSRPIFYVSFVFIFGILLTNSYLCNMISEEQQKKDERYMRMALDEAHLAYEAGEIPIGAVVVCKDRVISRAHNLTETLCDVTAHAEMQAITSAANTLGGKYLTDCTLYVTVEPCTMCAGAIGWAQIPRIVYGAADEKRGFHEYAPKAMHPKATITTGVLEEECRQLMQEFFRSRR